MFEDALYYISEGWGDRRQVIIVCYMAFEEFFTEFRKRYDRNPFIHEMISLDELEFDLISEYIGNSGIFDGR